MTYYNRMNKRIYIIYGRQRLTQLLVDFNMKNISCRCRSVKCVSHYNLNQLIFNRSAIGQHHDLIFCVLITK